MFIRFFETDFNTVAVAGLPLIFIELPPCDNIRVINKLPSWSVSKPLSRNKDKDSFDKSQNKLDYYHDPDKTYIRIMELMPGLPIGDFNSILEQAGVKQLGSVIKGDD